MAVVVVFVVVVIVVLVVVLLCGRRLGVHESMFLCFVEKRSERGV